MNTLKLHFRRFPLISSTLLIFIFIGLPFAISSFFTYFFGFELTQIRYALYNFSLSIMLIWLLAANGWDKDAGVTRHISNWRPRWWLWTLIFIIFELRFLSGVNWDGLTFSTAKVIDWLALTISIGLKEELLLRGLILYILYRSWGHTRLGLIKACLVQASLFGLIHYINVLAGHDISNINTQVIGTFFIGIAYGGLYLVTRSIWPVVLLHTLHNAIFFMNSQFGMAKFEMAPSSNNDIIPAIIFTGAIYTVYGIICLVKTPLYDRTAKTSSKQERDAVFTK